MLTIAFISYIILINLVSFHLYRIDKIRAERDEYRISEAFLLGASFLGGALGAFCAMREFHHKTLHNIFSVGVPIALVIQTAIVVFTIVYCLLNT